MKVLIKEVRFMDFNKRIKKYWEGEADLYSESIQKELSSFKRKAWAELILNNAPAKEKLKVLDIGTGPGFFPIILGERGHDVTGIDCTDNMLECAGRNCKREGVKAEFKRMDCHKTSFDDNTFDLIICRNLTWTLTEPGKAYREWHRILNKGGRLLVFDANWNMHLVDEKMKELYDEDMKNYTDAGYGEPPRHKDYEESEDISSKVPLSGILRPVWDEKELKETGFSSVNSKENISEILYDEAEKILYRSTPMFMVCAEK